jgi:hypothetical protein
MQIFSSEALLPELNMFLFQFISNKDIGRLKANPYWVDQGSEVFNLCFQVR